MNRRKSSGKDSSPSKGIRVKSLSALQAPPEPAKDDVILLSSDSEPPPAKDVIPPSVRRRKRKKDVAVKLEEVDEECTQSVSSTQTKRRSRKQQKMESIASKCYRMEDYFNPLTKAEWTETVQKSIEEVRKSPPREVKPKRKKGVQKKKANEEEPLKQFSSTRAKNPVTNIFVRRKMGKTTNLKMFGKRHLTDQQKRIQNYFAVHRGSTFRSYYDTFRESLFPIMIAGDINVSNFLSSILEATNDAGELFDYSVKKDKLVLQPKSGCSIDDEVHLMEILEAAIKKEEVDLEVNPCDSKAVKRDSSHASTSRDSAVSLTAPSENTELPIQSTEKVESSAMDRVSEAESDDTAARKPRRGRKVVCPPFKIICGTTFAVDAFRYGNIEKVSHYFLTHFHADHYVGLRKTFSKPIYLTEVTANLVKSFVKVKPEYLKVMKYNIPETIDGVEVTAIDANHCPGAAMFLFKLPSGENILHTGDFRATYLMEMLPIFWDNDIDTIYLDTTYLSSQTVLPSQEESIQMAIEETEKFLTKNIGQKCLVIVGTYVVGKEKVWHTLATRFGFRVWLEEKRRQAVECMEDPKLLDVLCANPCDAQLHVLPLGNLSYDYVVRYLSQYEREFTHVLALRPSGWEVNSRPRHQGNISIVGITYSEHSSYAELRRFVRFLRPHTVIPTVNAEGLKEKEKIPDKWLTRKVEPWREPQQSTITLFFPLKAQQRGREEFEGETENLTQLSLVGMCDPADVVSLSTDWMS